MKYQVLRTEVESDPNGRGYSGMSDSAVAIDMNTSYVSQNRTSMTGSEIVNAVVISEFNGLSADDKQLFWDIVHLGTINPFGVEATILTSVFGGGSDTIMALAVARVVTITRANELGLGTVKTGYIEKVRA